MLRIDDIQFNTIFETKSPECKKMDEQILNNHLCTLCINLFINWNLCKNIFRDSPKITNIEKTIE